MGGRKDGRANGDGSETDGDGDGDGSSASSLTASGWLQSFGAAVRGTRVALGLTLEEAAGRCEVHSRHLQKIEAGAVSPGVTTLVKIAEGFEVDLVSLLPPKVTNGDDDGDRSTEKGASAEQTLRTIGLRIRQARMNANLSQRELAARAGISPQYLQRIESGRQSMAVLVFRNRPDLGVVTSPLFAVTYAHGGSPCPVPPAAPCPRS